MKHLLVAILLTLLPGTLAWGAKEQDFVALMMERISSKPADYPTTDYENITVSPTMISYMLDMMDNDSDNSNLLPGNSAQNQEQLRQLLKDVKSLRIFTASQNTAKYKKLTLHLLGKHKNTYKEYHVKEQPGNSKHIWTRQSSNSVVEIILLNDDPDSSKPMQILNITGDFGDQFFETLMQIR